MRAHLLKTLTDATGAVLPNCSVGVYQAGTTTPIAGALWVNDTTTTTQLSNPFTSSSGVVNFYLDTTQRVRLGITPSGGTQVFLEDIDVLEPGDGLLSNNGAGVITVNADVLQVKPSDSTDTSATALALRDSAGVIWYFTVDTTGHLISSTTYP